MTAKYEDLWYHSDEGLRLYARDYHCPAVDAPTLLCMHGLSRNSADFAGLAGHLRDRYRVIAVDVRGRGRSDYDPDPSRYHPATYAGDMFKLLDQIELPRAVLVGTSMGGLMAFIMAASQPERVSAMVINDIGPEVDPRGLARIKSYVGKTAPVSSWEEAVAQARELNGLAFPDFSDREWLDFTRGLYREEGGVPVFAYDPAISRPIDEEQTGAVPPDLWPLFESSSDIPMLVVRGEHSDILSRDCFHAMADRRPGVRLAEIASRGHAPTLTEPAALTAIGEFLGDELAAF